MRTRLRLRFRTGLVMVLLLALAGCGTRVERTAPTAGGQPIGTSDTANVVSPEPNPSSERTGGSAFASPSSGNQPVAPSVQKSTSGTGSPNPAPGGTASRPTPADPQGEGATKHASPAEPPRTKAPPATPGTPTAPTPAPVEPGAPIVIGSVGNYSGPAGGAEAPGNKIVQVWVKWKNASGGVNGHPVHYITVDDGGDPARHRAAVQDLVEQRKVVAFVSQWASLTHQGASEYLLQKHVPVIGGDISTSIWQQNPMYFPQGTSIDNLIWGNLAVARQQLKGKKLGTFSCAEAPGCREIKTAMAKHAAETGFDLVYQAEGSVAAPDFTAQCLAARNQGVEVFGIVSDFSSQKRLATSCSRQGYVPEWIMPAPDGSFSDVKEFDGAVIALATFPFSLVVPETRDYRDAMSAYAASAGLGDSISTSMGWVAALLFERVVSKIQGDITTPAILDSLWSIRNESLGGLTSPLTFVRDQIAPVTPCVFGIVLRRGKFQATQGLTPVCHS